MSPEPCDEAYERGMRVRREVVGAHLGERAAVPADRRADGREQDRARHVASSSSSTVCATAKAELAAGTPQ